MVCRQLLGVQKHTTNIGVLLELGRIPLHFDSIKLAIKNWERIRKKQANTILQASYAEAHETKLPWIAGIKTYLEKNGMLEFFLNTHSDKPIFIHKKLSQRLADTFHQNSFNTIQSQESKLRTYGLL